jgi:hypothetical protein
MDKTDQELRELAMEMISGIVFTSLQVETQSLIQMVFMPLIFISDDMRKNWDENPEEAPAMLYESMAKAGPQAINGYPMFTSLHYLNKKELIRFKEFVQAATKSRDEFIKSGK